MGKREKLKTIELLNKRVLKEDVSESLCKEIAYRAFTAGNDEGFTGDDTENWRKFMTWWSANVSAT